MWLSRISDGQQTANHGFQRCGAAYVSKPKTWEEIKFNYNEKHLCFLLCSSALSYFSPSSPGWVQHSKQTWNSVLGGALWDLLGINTLVKGKSSASLQTFGGFWQMYSLLLSNLGCSQVVKGREETAWDEQWLFETKTLLQAKVFKYIYLI